jgi:hypothetical protein
MTTTLKAVTRGKPCQVCGGGHKCSRGEDGLILCGRRTGPQPGFVHLGSAKDEIWSIYRAEDERAASARSYTPPPKPRLTNWARIAERFASALTPQLADELCSQLGLPRCALDAMPLIGFDAGSKAWAFPEVGGRGNIIGVTRRFRDGSKRAMPGSQRGLTIPRGWRERGTPLCVVEGASDTLALSVCAVSCVGRPSNNGGTEHLAELLADFPREREIVVMGECDAKPDGSWPGRAGAIKVASGLAKLLGRRVAWALPPDGAKDVRAWVLRQNADHSILDSFHEIGQLLWS